MLEVTPGQPWVFRVMTIVYVLLGFIAMVTYFSDLKVMFPWKVASEFIEDAIDVGQWIMRGSLRRAMKGQRPTKPFFL